MGMEINQCNHQTQDTWTTPEGSEIDRPPVWVCAFWGVRAQKGVVNRMKLLPKHWGWGKKVNEHTRVQSKQSCHVNMTHFAEEAAVSLRMISNEDVMDLLCVDLSVVPQKKDVFVYVCMCVCVFFVHVIGWS